MEDEKVLLLDEANGFSVKSLFEALADEVTTPFPVHLVWNCIVPLQISFFMWHLWWDRFYILCGICGTTLTAMVGLCAYYITLDAGDVHPQTVFACGAAEETLGHLFIHFQVATFLWDYFLVRFRVLWLSPGSMRIPLECWPFLSFKGLSRVGSEAWRFIPFAICWDDLDRA